MKQQAKVSIIVPIFNAADYVLTCLQSIANQTYENIEVILINDGSTDDSGIIAEHFAYDDKRFQVYHIDNHGPAHARNEGIKRASGKWIQFVDADDSIAKTMTGALVDRTTEKIDLVICGYKGDKIYQPIFEDSYEQAGFLLQFGRLFSQGIIPSPCNKLYRHDIIKEQRIQFPENYRLGEDLLFQLQFLRLARGVSVTRDVLYFYTERTGSLTKRYIPQYMDIQIDLYEQTKQFLNDTKSNTTENMQQMDDIFAQQFRHAISNLHHPLNKMTFQEKRQLLITFFRMAQSKNFIQFYSQGIDQKLCRFFIQTKQSLLATGYFSVKEWLRMQAPTLFQLFRQGEKQ